jgi:cold shock protein
MPQEGTVKCFNDEKGFGFIKTDDGSEDVFVDHTGIAGGGFKSLEEGEKVTYELARGYVAVPNRVVRLVVLSVLQCGESLCLQSNTYVKGISPILCSGRR